MKRCVMLQPTTVKSVAMSEDGGEAGEAAELLTKAETICHDVNSVKIKSVRYFCHSNGQVTHM